MESSDDEKVSRRRGKPRCPKNYGRAKEWKAYNFQYRAYCVSRGKVAVEIAAGKKPPAERNPATYYDDYAEEVGGWEQLCAHSTAAEVVRYTRAVMKTIKHAQKAWIREEQDMFADMVCNTKNDALLTLMGQEVDGSVSAALAAFAKMYGTESEGSRFELLMKFLFSSKMRGKDLEAHITSIKDMLSDLAKLKPPEVFTPGLQVIIFVKSLMSKYPGLSAVITAAKRGDDKSVTLEEAINMARDHVSAKAMEAVASDSSDSSDSSDDEAALAVGTGTFKGKCFNCDEVGHRASECPKKRNKTHKRRFQRQKAAKAAAKKAESAKAVKATKKADKKKKSKKKKARLLAVFSEKAYAAATNNSKKRDRNEEHTLLLDTQASANFLITEELMSGLKSTDTEVTLADGAGQSCAKKGSMHCLFPFLGRKELEECKSNGGSYLVPDFVANLQSGQLLVAAGHDIFLSKKGSYIAVGGSKKDRIPISVTDAGFEIKVKAVARDSKRASKATHSPKVTFESEEEEEESEEEESEESEESEAEESSEE